jgi:hypothetical protein
MFVNIVYFPPIEEGEDAEFLEWSIWSNEKYASQIRILQRMVGLNRMQG